MNSLRLNSSLLTIIFVLSSAHILLAQNIVKGYLPGYGEVEYIENEVIVYWNESVSDAQIDEVRGYERVQPSREFTRFNAELWKLENMNVSEAILRYADHPDVNSIAPNLVFRLPEYETSPMTFDDVKEPRRVVPNDTLYHLQWGLNNTGQSPMNGTPGADIQAELAWEITTGSKEVIIAVLDSGIDYNHPDLRDNIWRDEDGNFGRNFSPGAQDKYDPMDGVGHGTHVSGIIGAIGNNEIGVTGMNWDVTIMAIKVFDDTGKTHYSSIIEGMEFVLDQSVRISNHSYGGYSQDSAVDILRQAGNNNHLMLAAAGNDRRSLESNPMYPANYNINNIISVGSSDSRDNLSRFSNYGVNNVDILAPGSQIGSTYPDTSYVYLNGTSMATPLVAGVAGLLLSMDPDLTAEELKQRILERADRFEHLTPYVAEGRRLNAFTTLLDDDGIPPATVSDLSVAKTGQRYVTLEWTAVGYSGMTGRAAYYQIISDQYEEVGDLVIYPKKAGEKHSLTIRNLHPGTDYNFALRAGDYFGNESELSNEVQFTTLSEPRISINQDSLNITLDGGDTTQVEFTISNEGDAPLQIQLPENSGLQYMADIESGFYKVSDNFKEFGASYEWVDISDRGEKLSIVDRQNGNRQVELPFEFPFYGILQHSAYVSINGFISFDRITAGSGGSTNRRLPATLSPFNLIAPYWGNLVQRNTVDSGIYQYWDEDHDRFIFQWNKMTLPPESRNTEKEYTFQVILHRSGAIEYHYRDVEAVTINHTIGIQDKDGSDALELTYNRNLAESRRSFIFIPRFFDGISTNESFFDIKPGETRNVTLDINASTFFPGSQKVEIYVSSNDLNQPFVKIPLEMNVTGSFAELQMVQNIRNTRLNGMDIYLNDVLLRRNFSFTEATSFRNIPSSKPINLTFYQANEPLVNFDTTLVLDDSLRYILFLDSHISDGGNEETSEIFILSDVKPVTENKVYFSFLNSLSKNTSLHAGAVDIPSEHSQGSDELVWQIDDLEYGEYSEFQELDNFEYNLFVSINDVRHDFLLDFSQIGDDVILAFLTGTKTDPEVQLVNSEGDLNTVPVITSTEEYITELPTSVTLKQNYPNPFNPITTIPFALPVQSSVKMEVFDITGRRVAEILNDQMSAGHHEIQFDARHLSSGVYMYRLQVGDISITRKLLLIK